MSKLVFRGLAAARRRRRGAAGFTLTELLVSVAILSIIMGAIAAAFIVTIDNEGSVQNRITDSSAAQIASAFYTRDIQSSFEISTPGAAGSDSWPGSNVIGAPPTPDNGPPLCPPPTSGLNNDFLLGLSWNNAGTQTETVVSYWVTPAPDAPSTSVAAGSGGAAISSFNGSGVLDVASTTAFPTSGSLLVATSSGTATITYTGTTSTTFLGAEASATGYITPTTTLSTGDFVTTTIAIAREVCANGSATAYSNDPVARNVIDPVVNVVYTADCDPAVYGTACEAQAATGWLPSAEVSSISLASGEPTSGYQFNLVAAPRSNEANGGSPGQPSTSTTTTTVTTTPTTTPTSTTVAVTTTTVSGTTTTQPGTSTTIAPSTTTTTVPVAPLVLLAGGAGPALNCDGYGDNVVVDGSAYIDSNYTPSIKLQGNPFPSRRGTVSFEATGGIYSNASSPQTAVQLIGQAQVIDGGTVISNPNRGSLTAPLSAGSEPDPYASLIPPSPPTLGTLNSYGPQDISSTTTLQAGDYGPVNITNNGGGAITVTLNGGEFASLSTSSDDDDPFQHRDYDVNLVLNPGSYIFDGPVTLSASGNVTLSPGEYSQGLHLGDFEFGGFFGGSNISVTLQPGNYIFG
ncbi:MAG TPA: prepilin-type N-terminal cleavage/methylation domain-containing protein, partial [Acidimicrobiales bacterium]|nr:prepilin-type N-terminal cleavage/methylation domain-containing protein [Acidimicrobiales bacterium]